MSTVKSKKWSNIVIGCLLLLLVILMLAALSKISFDLPVGSSGDESESFEITKFQMVSEPELVLSNVDNYGIRFKATIPDDLKAEVDYDASKSFKVLILPLTYFDTLYDETAEKMDWVAALEKSQYWENQAYLIIDAAIRIESNGDTERYVLRAVIDEIMYKNINRKFTAIAYLETSKDGQITREYASFAEGQSYSTIARSVSYLCAEQLNDNIVNGDGYTQTELNLLNSGINMAVDQANGLTDATDDGSTFTVALSASTLNLTRGDEVKPQVTIIPEVELPVWWISSNSSIVTVDNGIVKAVGVGTVNIYAYVAGQQYSCTVTVSK